MSFRTHCESLGIKLLRDDIEYIKHCLQPYSKTHYRVILETYVEVWLDAMGKCDIVYQKQNKGRFAANSWLRNVLCI